MKNLHKIFLVPVFVLACLYAKAQTFDEFEVKAVFLYNFTMFVQWPEHAFEGPQDPFIIGILGENVFNQHLEEVVKGEKVNGHPIVILQFADLSSVRKCHILYISDPHGADYPLHLKKISSDPTLTVSDHPAFLEKNGMMNLLNENNRIRLQVNVEATNAAGLTVSSKLLRLATLYKKK